jgi:hypothetical protein
MCFGFAVGVIWGRRQGRGGRGLSTVCCKIYACEISRPRNGVESLPKLNFLGDVVFKILGWK